MGDYLDLLRVCIKAKEKADRYDEMIKEIDKQHDKIKMCQSSAKELTKYDVIEILQTIKSKGII